MKITICGSIFFYEEMEKLKKLLEEKKHEVLIPLLRNEIPQMGNDRKVNFGRYIEQNGGVDSFPEGHPLWDMKASAIQDHYEKVEWSDVILVANYEKRGVSGYIGGNTLIEIGLAFYLKKPIYILNPISSEISYKQEVLGMKPVFLDENLDLIK